MLPPQIYKSLCYFKQGYVGLVRYPELSKPKIQDTAYKQPVGYVEPPARISNLLRFGGGGS